MKQVLRSLAKPSRIGLRWAIGGGLLAGLVLATTLWTVGSIRPFEADVLVKQFSKALLYFYASVVGGSSTILALMLAVLSLSSQSQEKLSAFHYRRLRAIARIVTIVLVVSLLAFVLVGLPLDRARNLSNATMIWVFYGLVGVTSAIAGTMITAVLALYTAVSDTIAVVGLGVRHEHLIEMVEAEEEEAQ